MIAFVIGFLAPFILGIYLSFCDFTTVTDAEFIGIDNYLKILGDKEFIHSLWYTALFTLVTDPLFPLPPKAYVYMSWSAASSDYTVPIMFWCIHV
mgnify:CR=1 FL=1